MDIQVDGGFVPSSLYQLVSALPLIRPIGSIAIELDCTNGALESWARKGLIPPPMLFGSRRTWLRSEVALMSPRDGWRGREGDGHLVLEQRIKTLFKWIAIVADCGNRFDSEYVPAANDRRRNGGEELRGRGTFKGVCRRSDAAPVWHRLPYTYGTFRHLAAGYRPLASARGPAGRLVRIVDVIEWNLTEQFDRAMRSKEAACLLPH